MARPGTALATSDTSSSTPSFDTVNVRRLGILDSVGALQNYIKLISGLIGTTNSAEVEGRYVKKEGLEAITNAEVHATAGIVGTKLSAGAGVLAHLDTSGVFDSLANVTNRSLDWLSDGTYGKVLAGALSFGKINFTAGTLYWANKNLDNLPDGATYLKVAGVNGSNKITNASVDAAAAIDGSKLKEGSGPLGHLSSLGVLDNLTSVTTRSLDDITDGATFKKVTGVSAGNQVQAGSIASNAVEESKINAAAVTTAKVAAATLGAYHVAAQEQLVNLVRNGNFAVAIRG